MQGNKKDVCMNFFDRTEQLYTIKLLRISETPKALL